MANALSDIINSGQFAAGLQRPSQNPFGQWAQGVAQRTMNPIATLAGESQRYMQMPPGELAGQFGPSGGSLAGLAGTIGRKAAKTEFELAHEVAQRNAALPVEQGGLGLHPDNTAMDRAKAMGFDTPAYHGGRNEIIEFDPKRGGGAEGYTSGTGSWFDSNQEVASEYADRVADKALPDVVQKEFDNLIKAVDKAYSRGNYDLAEKLEQRMIDIGEYGQGANVIPAMLNLKNIKTEQGRAVVHGEIQKDMIDKAKKSRKSGVLFENITDNPSGGIESNQYLMFKPQNIRSRFAAFDPMQRNSANILAGGIGGAIGLNTLADLANQQEYQ
jgi:hypothetical protein